MPAEFAPSGEGLITIVFGTFNYRNTILRWMEFARKAKCKGFKLLT